MRGFRCLSTELAERGLSNRGPTEELAQASRRRALRGSSHAPVAPAERATLAVFGGRGGGVPNPCVAQRLHSALEAEAAESAAMAVAQPVPASAAAPASAPATPSGRKWSGGATRRSVADR